MSWDFEKHYINGEWTPSEDDAWIEVENPATLERFARIPDGTPADADRAVAAAKAALEGWRTTPLAERIRLMKAMLANFEALHDEIIPLEVAELGAPVGFTTRTHCEYQYVRVRSYIEAAERMVLEETLPNSTVYREPVGVVACVTPWNYPLGQVVQKVVPAILMGCTVVLKPSQHTPLTACLLADAFDRAGFPKGVFNMVSGRGSRLGDRLASHPDVDMVSFTGSTTVGIRIAQRALESVKHISLELGGKSPAVFLPSDDYSAAYPKILSSIFFNAGQTCTALSRLIVPRRDLARIESEFCELAAKLVVGDPTDPKTDIGPVSSKAQFEKIAEYVQAGIDEGARLVMGGVHRHVPRLLRQTRRLLRREKRHAHRPRGDLRPRALHHSLRHRRGGRLNRQRHALRTLGLRARPDEGRGGRGRKAHPLGQRLHQRRPARRHRALRRLQAERHRT